MIWCNPLYSNNHVQSEPSKTCDHGAKSLLRHGGDLNGFIFTPAQLSRVYGRLFNVTNVKLAEVLKEYFRDEFLISSFSCKCTKSIPNYK